MSKSMKCATDRDIHDLLLSNQQKFTTKVLRELALDRNIICSDLSDRKQLADYLSIITHDHHDLDYLIEKRETKNRREVNTFDTYKIKIDGGSVKDILNKLRSEYLDDEAKSLKFTQTSSATFRATYSYTDMHYSKTRFTQRQHNQAEISFDIRDDELQVRMPAGLRATPFPEELKKKVQEKILNPIEALSISLENIKEPELRSSFFLKLISSIDNLRFNGVNKVKVSSKHLIPDAFEVIENNVEDDNAEEGPIEEDTFEESAEMLQAIHRMILDGENIESSSEYQELTKKGYFINSISWIATEKISPYTQYYMEAGFSDSETCKLFRYSLKGVKNVKKGTYNKTWRPPSIDNLLWFNNAIENISRTIFDEIVKEKKCKEANSE